MQKTQCNSSLHGLNQPNWETVSKSFFLNIKNVSIKPMWLKIILSISYMTSKSKISTSAAFWDTMKVKIMGTDSNFQVISFSFSKSQFNHFLRSNSLCKKRSLKVQYNYGKYGNNSYWSEKTAEFYHSIYLPIALLCSILQKTQANHTSPKWKVWACRT